MMNILKTFTLLLLVFICTSFRPSDPDPEEQMEQKAIELANTLESAIDIVVIYGKKNWDVKNVIQETIMPNIEDGAKIETASINLNGVKRINPAQPYDKYFTALWRTANGNPNLKVYFSDVKVKKIDKYRYLAVVQFVQEYESGKYADTTTKDIYIDFNKRPVRIGDTKVVDIKRRNR